MAIEHETGEVSGDPRPPMSDEDVKEMAMKIVQGECYPSWAIPEHDQHLLPSIFMPLMFLDDITRKELESEGVMHLVGNMRDAFPRGINGYPMFGGMQTLTGDDARRVNEKCIAIQAAMDAA